MEVKSNMMMNDDHKHDNDGKFLVGGNVKRIVGIRICLSCYKKKTNDKTADNKL